MKFAVRDDLIKVGTDWEDGEDVLARRLYVIAEAADGRRWAHTYGFITREQRRCPEEGISFWAQRPEGAAEAEAQELRDRIAKAHAAGRPLDPLHWNEIDPAYGSDAYQSLDNERFFRNREIMDAHEAGEISEYEAARLMTR